MEKLSTQTPAIDKAVRVLEYLAHQDGATFSQIYQEVGLPKSTASSLLASLVVHGLLRLEKNHYFLGIRLYTLGQKAEDAFDIKRLAMEPLQQLRDETQLTCHLGVLDGSAAIYLVKLETPGAIIVRSWVGKKLSLYSSGLGKALLAWLPEEEVNRLVPDEKLERYTDTTILERTALKKELAVIRAKGWAYDNAEDSVGVYCIAAPIFDEHGQVVAAISLSGVSFQVPQERREELARQVMMTAQSISLKLR